MRLSVRVIKGLFLGLLLLGALDRAHILYLTIGHASDDLTVVWLAAQDYAQGVFHEPFFYGQNYGVMLEALLAAPFVALGADPAVAVPIVIAFLAMVPFWSFAVFHFRQRVFGAAMLFAALPLLLPAEHGIQYTNLNGLAVLACYPWIHGMRRSWPRPVLLGALLCAAVAVNMNTLVAVAGFGTLFFLQEGRRSRNVLLAVCGALPVLVMWWVAMRSYTPEADRMVNTLYDWRFTFHPELIPESLAQLDAHFAWLCPLWWPNGQVVLWALIAVAVVLFRTEQVAMGWALVAALSVVLLSFAFPKVHDGTGSVFFPLSRMYLAVPLILAWAVAHLRIEGRVRSPLIIGLCIAAVIGSTLRTMSAPRIVEQALADQEGLPIRVRPVAWLRTECRTIQAVARATEAEAVVVLREPDVYYAQFVSIGCPVCEPTLPPTYMPERERRSWRIDAEAMARRGKILIVNGNSAIWEAAYNGTFHVQRLREREPSLHLITGAGLPVDTLLQRIGQLPVR